MREFIELGLREEHKKRDFFKNCKDLKEQDNLELKQMIEGSKGAIRIVVHPYYDHYVNPDKPNPGREKVVEGLKRMVRANFIGSAEIKTPIFIFEEEGAIKKTQENLQEALSGIPVEKIQHPVYFMPTFESSPEPTFYQDARQGRRQKDNVQTMIEFFASLGVKKIMLGGEFLMTPRHRLGENKAVGCVNGLKEVLEKHFQIELSNMSYPATRKDSKDVDGRRDPLFDFEYF